MWSGECFSNLKYTTLYVTACGLYTDDFGRCHLVFPQWRRLYLHKKAELAKVVGGPDNELKTWQAAFEHLQPQRTMCTTLCPAVKNKHHSGNAHLNTGRSRWEQNQTLKQVNGQKTAWGRCTAVFGLLIMICWSKSIFHKRSDDRNSDLGDHQNIFEVKLNSRSAVRQRVIWTYVKWSQSSQRWANQVYLSFVAGKVHLWRHGFLSHCVMMKRLTNMDLPVLIKVNLLCDW